MMRIAIRAPNWIGDGVMAIPAIRAFHDFFPDSSLHIVCKKYLADIFLHLPGIDGVVPLPDTLPPSSMLRVTRSLSEMNFDLGILLTNSFGSALLFKLAKIKEIAGYNRDGRGFLLDRRVQRLRENGHHRDYYLHLAAQIAGKSVDREWPIELALTAEEKNQGQTLLLELGIPAGSPLVGIAPTAAYGTAKCWPADLFSAWMKQWQQKEPASHFLLLGSAKEKEKIDRLLPTTDFPAHCLAGQLTLRQSMQVLSLCRLVVGNDSGIMHIASALGLPLVALFGPTLPQKTGPSSPHQRILFHPAECTPCRYRDCPVGHGCMKAITVDEVTEAGQSVLEETAGGPSSV